jgi:DNA-binding XRE family transcriptional regulator
MTPDEHYQEAERLIGLVNDDESGDTMLTTSGLLALAQIHATLAAAPAPAPAVTAVTAVAIGDRVRELRTLRGLSQEALASAMSKAGLTWHQATVYKIEIGNRALRYDEAITLAELLNVDLAVLGSGAQ